MEELSHLPIDKQNDILKILEIIKEVAVPEKVILFGSFARGDWVDDEYVENGATYTYRSDFDFLVVTRDSKLLELEIKNRIENRTRSSRHPVNPLVHDLKHINYGLERGQYFFKSIIESGILLFDTKSFDFVKSRALSIEEQREQALCYYNNWIESGVRLLRIAEVAFDISLEEDLAMNEVLFLLHQTAEKFYAGLGLIYNGYKPKTHSIKEYRNYTKEISEEINKIFLYPESSSKEEELFEILQKSYIDARYKQDFYVNKADVKSILEKIQILKVLTIKYSLKKLNSIN
ncbi:HEPN domain-containing protein [Sphingobacterium hotanense]|uniref:HEPN domain-containing protein n=1 Tax=Sphingobacterium hotanense TaxID=649196 RepID=UPI0011F36966|nr:HEPN domain-containing protein [Sphingobacterium hotanense]